MTATAAESWRWPHLQGSGCIQARSDYGGCGSSGGHRLTGAAMSRIGRGYASSAAIAMGVPPLQLGWRQPAASTSAAAPHPQWWRWPRPRCCYVCSRLAVRRPSGSGGPAYAIGGDGFSICGGGCHSRSLRRLGPKAIFGAVTSPAALAAVGVAVPSRPSPRGLPQCRADDDRLPARRRGGCRVDTQDHRNPLPPPGTPRVVLWVSDPLFFPPPGIAPAIA